MSDINNVTLTGRLVRAMELKYLPNGTPVGRIDLAVNKKRKDNGQTIEETSYIRMNLWGKMAESLSKYLLQGVRIGVVGELQQKRWEKNGQKRSAVEVKVGQIQILEFKDDGQSRGSGNNQGAQRNQSQNQNRQQPPQNPPQNTPQYAGSGNNQDYDFDDDIPF